MPIWNRFAVLGALGMLLAPISAQALPVYGTDIGLTDYTGSRSIAGGGLVKGGGSFTAATIGWTITDNGNGTLHYAYSVDTNSQQGLSHFILDLSDNCTAVGSCFSNLTVTGGNPSATTFGTWSNQQGNSNPGMPGPIVGFKIDVDSGGSDFGFAFDSNRVPVWEDFFAKGGNGGTGRNANGFSLFNAGLSFEATDMNTGHFIPFPDTVFVPPPCQNCTTESSSNPVPEPGSLALLGAGLSGFGIARRRRQRA